MKKEKITPLKWKKETDRELRQAVARFNKKVRELQIDGTREYLPEEYDYKELHKKIKSREELSRVLHNLSRFGKEGQEELVTLEGGQAITKWEKNKLEGERKRVEADIKQELQELNEKMPGSNFSRAQMGSIRVNTLEAQLKNLENFEKLKGEAFQKLKNKITAKGTTDFSLRKAINYRNNYENTIKNNFKNFDGFDELQKAFDKHKNPFDFFRWMKSTGNINIIDISYESNNVFTQESFYRYLEDLGIKYNKKKEIVETTEKE